MIGELSTVSLKDVYTMGRNLLNAHGLTDWSFDFDRSVRRYGICNYTRKRISVSFKLSAINPVEQTRDVVLHEIAHALTPGARHGFVWRQKCREIGAKPERCYRSAEVAQPKRTCIGKCPNCNLTIKRFRRRRLICKMCRVEIGWGYNSNV
jgi:predicted SprT family Zn-dependent metalloprotease